MSNKQKQIEEELDMLLSELLSKGHFGGNFRPDTCDICKEAGKKLKGFVKRKIAQTKQSIIKEIEAYIVLKESKMGTNAIVRMRRFLIKLKQL